VRREARHQQISGCRRRPRSIPGVGLLCYKLHRRTEQLQFNHGHSLIFPRTATVVEARAHRINLFQYPALRSIACGYLRPVRRFIRQLRILADARTADSEVNGCGRGDQNARRHLQGEALRLRHAVTRRKARSTEQPGSDRYVFYRRCFSFRSSYGRILSLFSVTDQASIGTHSAAVLAFFDHRSGPELPKLALTGGAACDKDKSCGF